MKPPRMVSTVASATSTTAAFQGRTATTLVAFVSISLVVSSIMIGIITYISVLERRKEIMLMILVTEVIRVPTTSVYWITLSSAPCSRMAAL